MRRNPLPLATARGFTLLEVLAAVLIFAMVVTMLIGSSSETIHRAGVSRTYLQASEIADRELAQLESQLILKKIPPEDREETREEFSVRVFSTPALDDFGGGGGGRDDATGGAPALSLAAGGAGAGVAALLRLQAPGIDKFLLRYEIVVEWIEGPEPSRVRRTTYAFDWESARAALPDLFAAGDLGEGIGSGLDTTDPAAQDLIRQIQEATP